MMDVVRKVILNPEKPGKLHRFETASGLFVETFDQAIPIYDAEQAAINWFDIPSRPIVNDERDCPEQSNVNVYASKLFSDFITALSLKEIQRSISDAGVCSDPNVFAIDQFFAITPTFQFDTAVASGVERARKSLAYQSRLVGHRIRKAVLLAGRRYLTSASDRERTELSAKSHVTHLEFLALSRNHGSAPVFPAVFAGLRGLSGGRCSVLLNLLCDVSNRLSHFMSAALSIRVRASFSFAMN
jgi:hypothetical protein